MRTSPPWIQHRDLNLCSLQTCLIRNSAPQPTNACSFIILATPFPLCHHHHTTLSFLHRDSRLCHGFNRRRLDGDAPHPTLLNSTSFFQRTHLVYSIADATRYSNRERLKTSRALSSRHHQLWSTPHRGPACGCDRDSTAWVRTTSHRHRKTHSERDRRCYTWFGSHS